MDQTRQGANSKKNFMQASVVLCLYQFSAACLVSALCKMSMIRRKLVLVSSAKVELLSLKEIASFPLVVADTAGVKGDEVQSTDADETKEEDARDVKDTGGDAGGDSEDNEDNADGTVDIDPENNEDDTVASISLSSSVSVMNELALEKENIGEETEGK